MNCWLLCFHRKHMLDGGDDYEHEDDEFNGVQNWRNNWIGLKIVYHFLGNYFLLVSFITNLVRTVKSSIALFGWVRGILSLINITYNSVIMYFWYQSDWELMWKLILRRWTCIYEILMLMNSNGLYKFLALAISLSIALLQLSVGGTVLLFELLLNLRFGYIFLCWIMVFVGLNFILETKLQMLGAGLGQNLVLDGLVTCKTSLSGKII